MHTTEPIPSSLINKDESTVANAFNYLFLSATEKLNIQKSNKGDAISFLKDSFPRNVPSIELMPITAAETKRIISSVKPKNSSGYDEITSEIKKKN